MIRATVIVTGFAVGTVIGVLVFFYRLSGTSIAPNIPGWPGRWSGASLPEGRGWAASLSDATGRPMAHCDCQAGVGAALISATPTRSRMSRPPTPTV